MWLNVVFQADYDEIELQKNQLWRHFSDVMAIMSPKNVNKNVTKIFHFEHSQSKFLATPVLIWNMSMDERTANYFPISQLFCLLWRYVIVSNISSWPC